jgi:hypothetical protein
MKLKITNRPRLVGGKMVDRWFAPDWSITQFWQKREYAEEYLKELGFETE